MAAEFGQEGIPLEVLLMYVKIPQNAKNRKSPKMRHK
jgi:hypothetical protein